MMLVLVADESNGVYCFLMFAEFGIPRRDAFLLSGLGTKGGHQVYSSGFGCNCPGCYRNVN